MTMSADDVRRYMDEQQQERKKKKGDDTYWVAPEGANYLRLGPPWVKDGDFWKDRLLHGPFEDRVYCAKNDVNEETGKPRKCLVCARYKELKGDKSKFGKALSKLIYPRADYLWNILPVLKWELDGSLLVPKKLDTRFRVLTASRTLHEMLVEFFADEEYRQEHIYGITHMRSGRFIRLRREGTELDTEYRVKVLSQVQPVSKDKETRVALVKTLNDLDAMVEGSSDEDLQGFLRKMEKRAKGKAASGEEDKEDNGGDERSSRKRDKDEDQDGNGEDDDKPRGKKRDRDDDEDEDEDKPRGKRGHDEDEDRDKDKDEDTDGDGKDGEDDDGRSKKGKGNGDDGDDEAEQIYREYQKRYGSGSKKKGKQDNEDDDDDKPRGGKAKRKSQDDDDDIPF